MSSLTASQTRHLKDYGYMVIPSLVSQHSVNAALRVINNELGEYDEDRNMACLDICSTISRPILDLYRASPVKSICGSLIVDCVNPTGAQVALTVPELAWDHKPVTPHIDGLPYPGNGIPEGTVRDFTALVGVFLSDTTEEDCGNFTVWPRGHSHLESWAAFRERQGLIEDLLAGDLPKMVAHIPPRQILARAGDVVITHYLTAHAPGWNLSPNIRYAVFFRITSGSKSPESLVDIWKDWNLADEKDSVQPLTSEGGTHVPENGLHGVL